MNIHLRRTSTAKRPIHKEMIIRVMVIKRVMIMRIIKVMILMIIRIKKTFRKGT